MADAPDSKSGSPDSECGFESHLRQFEQSCDGEKSFREVVFPERGWSWLPRWLGARNAQAAARFGGVATFSGRELKPRGVGRSEGEAEGNRAIGVGGDAIAGSC